MKKIMLIVFTVISLQVNAQETGVKSYLYGDQEIPDAAKPISEMEEADKPKLYAHLATSNVKDDLVFLIIPGGGYARVAIGHEGHDVAKRLNDLGYHAYVLDYRLPKVETMKEKRFGPLQDAQMAMQRIRKENKGKKIVVIGFSAGGHLAGTLANFYDKPQVKGWKKADLRPDFSILCYPVISMEDGVTHKGSKQNLIGPVSSQTDVELFSLDKQVSKRTPPTFLMSAKDDQAVPIENSLRYQASLEKFAVPNTLYTYEKGGHGFGMHNKTSDADWFAEMLKWISVQKHGK